MKHRPLVHFGHPSHLAIFSTALGVLREYLDHSWFTKGYALHCAALLWARLAVLGATTGQRDFHPHLKSIPGDFHDWLTSISSAFPYRGQYYY